MSSNSQVEKEVLNLMDILEKKYASGELPPHEYINIKLKCLEMLKRKSSEERKQYSWFIGSAMVSLAVGFLAVAIMGVISATVNSVNPLNTMFWVLGFTVPALILLKSGLKSMGGMS
ncbi:MAG: hypothetical protein ACTSSJ_01695 [Candidatus Odinarchaeia archaeon]